jgi:type II secretory pathway component PulC
VNRKTARRLSLLIGALAAIILIAAAALFAHALLSPRQPRDFSTLSQGADPTPTAGMKSDATDRDMDSLAKRKMTRTIVKAPPAPPPKPAAPALNTLIRLTGVMDIGGTKEAIIEIKKSKQSKSYRDGAAIEDTGAIIKNIQNSVLIDYDGKTFRLSVGGEIEEVKTDPGGSPVAPKSKPAPSGGEQP